MMSCDFILVERRGVAAIRVSAGVALILGRSLRLCRWRSSGERLQTVAFMARQRSDGGVLLGHVDRFVGPFECVDIELLLFLFIVGGRRPLLINHQRQT